MKPLLLLTLLIFSSQLALAKKADKPKPKVQEISTLREIVLEINR